MKVTHSLNLKHVQKEVDHPFFVIGDKAGSYAFLGTGPFSKYGGLYVRTQEGLFKVLEDIVIDGSNECDEIHNSIHYVQRYKVHNKETFAMPDKSGVLLYMLEKRADIRIYADVKKPYDDREFGRFYTVEKGRNHITLVFEKRTDSREDETHAVQEYKLYVVLYSDDCEKNVVNAWEKRSYWYDRKRNSESGTRWVIEPVKMSLQKLTVAVSHSKRDALKRAREWYHKYISTKDLLTIIPEKTLNHLETKLAYHNCENSLQLMLHKHGMYAGIPWFFQTWTRDVSISSRALWLTGHVREAKRLLIALSKQHTHDGALPSQLGSDVLPSADGTGFVFHRLWELFVMGKLGPKSLSVVRDRLIHTAYLLQKFRTLDGLEVCKPKESWMDSLERSGALVELQALRASMYRFLSDFKQTRNYLIKEMKLIHDVGSKFIDKGTLYDAQRDSTVRPNIFIAAYVFKGLLPTETWEQVIDTSIEKLWLPWGGFSTLDKTSHDFRNVHTGENPESYHNGDSWFFVNLMAAIAMVRINRYKYKKYIKSILEASTKEILWSGCVGHHTELSSAKEMRSEGCPAQAWSSALYIELVHELYDDEAQHLYSSETIR